MSILVIDISYWQQNVNYDLLSQSIDGVILRAAYGASKDTWFERHYEGFTRNGKPIGAYHYIIGSTTPNTQANVLMDAIKGKRLTLGIWNDVEDTRAVTGLNRSIVLDYHHKFESLYGGKMGVYTSASKWDAIMRQPDLQDRKLWIANYGVTRPALPRTGGWSAWWLWQYTDRERLPGHTGALDGNRFFGTREQFEVWTGVTLPQPEPEPGDDMIYVIEMLGHMVIRDAPNGAATGHYALRGEIFHSDAERDGWYRITREGVTGWIFGGEWTRITIVPVVPTEPEPPVPPTLTLEERVASLEQRVTALEAK
jgi:GH25 family lysozyme M1 (1,4-beta-N-acetylmuramidase)